MSLEPKHPLDEQLSAFLDGEIDREAARFLIRRLERDPAARARLGRLAMIGACLRGETRGRPDTRLAARVAELIARECRPPARRRAWWSWPVGAALAAGVAGAVLLAGAPPVSERGTGSPAAGVVAGTADVAPGEQPAERLRVPVPPRLGLQAVSWTPTLSRPAPLAAPVLVELPRYLRASGEVPPPTAVPGPTSQPPAQSVTVSAREPERRPR